MSAMVIDRAVVEQALESLEARCGTFADERQPGGVVPKLRAALAQMEGGGNPPPPLTVPPEVAATITTTDIAWLLTHRLTKIWQELGQMRWAGADEGWDRAIEAVRRRLDAECQDVLNWKAQADQSGATAAELLQKVQGLRA